MTQDASNEQGTVLGINRADQGVYRFPGFDRDSMNGHLTVTGGPESGRTFLGKLRTIREHRAGRPVIVVDAEGEYTGLVKRLGGRAIHPGSPGNGINPMFWSSIREDLEEDARGHVVPRLGALRSVIQAIIKSDSLDDPGDIIGAALVRYCGRCLERNETDGMSLEGYCDELERGSRDSREARPMAAALRAFLDGGGQELTGGTFRVETEGVTSFDLTQVREELRPAAAAICLNAAWDFAMTHPEPKVLIVDDSRWSAGGGDSGDLLNYLIRRARKLRLGVMTIAAETAAFTDPGTRRGWTGRAIMQNSAARLALGEREAGLEAIREALGLDQQTRELVGTARQGEAVAMNEIGEATSVTIRADPDELELIAGA